MKKLITIIISIILLTCCGCGGVVDMGYKAPYWHENEAIVGFMPLNEEITYDVKVVNKKLTNSTEVSNEVVKMEVSKGVFVTNLSMKQKDGYDYYLYTTSLIVEGKYVFHDGNEFEFVNDYVTNTEFHTQAHNFRPIKSTKTSTNSTTAYIRDKNYAVYNLSYNYQIEYDDKDAKVEYKLINNKGNEEVKKASYTIDNYAKSNYVDNELLMLMPRAFDLSKSFTKSFKTIDVINQNHAKMLYYLGADDENSSQVVTLGGYEINGVPTESDIKTSLVNVLLNDTFSGAGIDAYYALDHKTHRHRLIKAYTSLNDNMGYLEYTIKSVKG